MLGLCCFFCEGSQIQNNYIKNFHKMKEMQEQKRSQLNVGAGQIICFPISLNLRSKFSPGFDSIIQNG